MRRNGSMANITDRRRDFIAEKTLKYIGVDKVSFLWGDRVVIGFTNPKDNSLHLITNLDYEDTEQVNRWFAASKHPALVKEDEANRN